MTPAEPNLAPVPPSSVFLRSRSPSGDVRFPAPHAARTPDPLMRPAQAQTQAAPAMDRVLALVLAGGRGTRLGALTERRAKPAVPIAGRHRIIDFTLNNCVQSGIPRIAVLTQYMAQSLTPHLRSWKAALPHSDLRVLASAKDDGYCGTADAVYQNRDLIRTAAPTHVLVLAADHVYDMDYSAMLKTHVERNAKVTVACIEVPLATAREFGVMKADGDGRIASFLEKPQSPQPMAGRSDVALASMGIYLFDTAYLLQLLDEDAADAESEHDFGKNVIPRVVASGDAWAHEFRDRRRPWRPGYWRDVGTIDAYWRTNLELQSGAVPLRLAPSPVIGRGAATQTREDVDLVDTVVAPDARIGAGSRLQNCIVLPGAVIGEGCNLRNAIIDEGVRIADGTVIGEDLGADREQFPVSAAGVALVTRDVSAAA